MGLTPGVTVSSQGPYKREAEGQRQRDGGFALLAVKMEGRAARQRYGASRSWKRQEPLKGAAPPSHGISRLFVRAYLGVPVLRYWAIGQCQQA